MRFLTLLAGLVLAMAVPASAGEEQAADRATTGPGTYYADPSGRVIGTSRSGDRETTAGDRMTTAGRTAPDEGAASGAVTTGTLAPGALTNGMPGTP